MYSNHRFRGILFPLLFSTVILLLEPVSGENSPTLATAISRSLERNPGLASFDARIRASDARIVSALALPNPELEAEAEDILGDGTFEGFGSAIYNLGISQLIETGGKRRLRGEVAEFESEQSRLEYEVAKRDLISEVSERFVAVLAAQMIEENAREILEVARQTSAAIEKQVEAGRGSAIEAGNAKMSEGNARVALKSANLQTQLACQRLSALWADPVPDFERVIGTLATPVDSSQTVDDLCANLATHPRVRLAQSGLSAAKSRLSLEESRRKPDVTMGVGYRRDNAVEDNAVVIGFSLPIPLFDRNAGGIAEAVAGIDENESLVSAAKSEIRLRISTAHAELEAARMSHDLVSGELLETAKENFRNLTEAYELGRTTYLELLEARRALQSVQKQKIEALANYHAARVRIEALTAAGFDTSK